MRGSGGALRMFGMRLLAGLTMVLAVIVVVGCASGGAGGGGGEYPSQDIQIMVPADPGGGYDQLGRAVQKTLTDTGTVEGTIEVFNKPGASGTAALTQLVTENAGDPHQLMVMGSILVGATKTTDSPVTLEDTTPIAELSSEYEVIVVPADSEFEDLGQLVGAMTEDPGSVSWGGGSTGGVDQILVAQLAEAAGMDPAEINYVPYAGGGEASSAILSGDVSAGVSGVGEFREQVEAGEMRALAVSSEEPIEGFDAPTLIDAGYDVTISNWRGLVAPPDLADGDRQAVIGMIEEMHGTPEWKSFLEDNNFEDSFKTGEEFGSYIKSEDERITTVLEELGLTK